MHAHRWSPPSLDTAALQARRWACLAPWVTLAADDWEIQVMLDAPPETPPACSVLGLQWTYHGYRISLPTSCLHAIGLALGVRLDQPTLPGDLRALLLETAMLPALIRLEHASGGRWRWLNLPPKDIETSFWATLRHRSARWPIRVEGSEAAVAALFSWWPVIQHSGLDDLRFPLRIRRGQTTLPWPVVASLRPDDVILLQKIPDSGYLLIIAESQLAPLREHPAGWLMTARSAAPTDLKQNEWLMDSSDDEQAVGINDPENLPIKLSFDVGSLTLSLAELRLLTPGRVLETGRALPQVVDIYAYGARIGHGELVEINGRLGVSIVEIFTRRDDGLASLGRETSRCTPQ